MTTFFSLYALLPSDKHICVHRTCYTTIMNYLCYKEHCQLYKKKMLKIFFLT